MKIFSKHILPALFCGITMLPAAALAADNWVDYKSPSGVFESRMPEQFETKSTQLLVGDNRVVTSEETSAIIDQRPYKNIKKSFAVKFDQTFGPALSEPEIKNLLLKEFDKYTAYYKGFKGVIRQQDSSKAEEKYSGNIYISYEDPDLGPQSIRAYIAVTGTTRLQQIVIGPDELMSSYQTRDFFESLKMEDGISATKDTFQTSWKFMESPLGTFSVLYPGDKKPPFFAADPVSKSSGRNEIVSLAFRDPLREESAFFNVYGYQFDTPFSYASAQQLMTKNHILKQGASLKGLKFKQGAVGDLYSYVEARYSIPAPKAFPFLQTVRLRTIFKGNVAVVEEVMSSNALMRSKLVDTLPDLVDFHPEKRPVAPTVPAPTAPPPAAPATP